MQDKTLGDMIQHDFAGQIGMSTGTYTNNLALERREKQLSAARKERSVPRPPPTPSSTLIFPLSAAPANPTSRTSNDAFPGQKKRGLRSIPAWKWYLAGVATGLIIPLFF